VVAAIVVAALAIGVSLLQHGPDSLTQARATFGRIKPGMTLAEVTAILGPPGNYTNTEIEPKAYPAEPTDLFGDVMNTTFHPESIELWLWDTHGVWVSMDSGKVTGGTFVPMRPKKDGFMERLVQWSKRQWHRWFP
jgi:hypothetical protein